MVLDVHVNRNIEIQNASIAFLFCNYGIKRHHFDLMEDIYILSSSSFVIDPLINRRTQAFGDCVNIDDLGGYLRTCLAFLT